jgi:hypothetical protein
MKTHILQAEHNVDFHNNICSTFPELYFDWKITVQFYTALHLLKALAKKEHKDIGNNHSDIFRSIRWDNDNAVMKISRTAGEMYNDLYSYSHSVRYDGIGHLIDIETWNSLKKEDHKACVDILKKFILYIKARGIPVN